MLVRVSLFLAGCVAFAGCRERPQENSAASAPEPEPVPVQIALETEEEDANAWKPAEHQKGAGRWKDTAVYADGRPIGMLNFGELPLGLQPVWVEDKVSAPKKPGSSDPGYKIVKQRHYRFTDYLQVVGVDLKKIKALHLYGGKPSDVLVVSGDELRARGKNFLFRFGGDVWGKAIPVTPSEFGNGKSPDKISAVMVYLDKKAPVHVRNVGMELDGQIVRGVPYFGEPLRGGVRVYFENRLAAIIKRKQLDDPNATLATVGDDGGVRWNLFAYLQAQGIDTKKVVEAWVVYDERRVQKLSREELATTMFEAVPQAKGEVQVVSAGHPRLPASAIALHTRPVTQDQLPQILPEEDGI